MADPAHQQVANKRKRPELTEDERKRIVDGLLRHGSTEGNQFQPARGALSKAAKEFGVGQSTISRIWKRAADNRAKVGAYAAIRRKKGRCGRRQVYNREEIQEAIQELPLHQRRSIRSIAAALGIPSSTIHTIIHEKYDGEMGSTIMSSNEGDCAESMQQEERHDSAERRSAASEILKPVLDEFVSTLDQAGDEDMIHRARDDLKEVLVHCKRSVVAASKAPT